MLDPRAERRNELARIAQVVVEPGEPLELHQEGAVLLLEHDDLRLPRRGAEAAGENGFTLFDQVERWFSPGNYSPVVYS